MLKKEWLKIRVIKKRHLLIKETEKKIIKKIKKLEIKSNKVVEEIEKVGVRVLRYDELQIKNELVLKEKKMYALKNKNLKLEIIWLYHNILIVGYRKKQKTVMLVTKNYQWSEVTKKVKKYIEKYS